jgi:hypothetical protein
MASSTSAPLQEWLVIVPDHAEALQKRLASRPKHLEGLKADRDDMWLWGGMFYSYLVFRLLLESTWHDKFILDLSSMDNTTLW